MWHELKAAARIGLILGVQYGITLVVILLMLLAVAGDYAVVRQRAASGQQAFDFIQQEIAARQRQSAITPPKEKGQP